MEFKEKNYFPIANFKNRDKKKTNPKFMEKYNQRSIEWSIFNTTESEESINHGRMIMPSSRINDKINNETVLNLLNSKNLFENYAPSLGDILTLNMAYVLKNIKKLTRSPLNPGYLCFEYKEHIWTESSMIYKGEITLLRKGWLIEENGS